MKFSSAIALTILAASANGYELLKDYAKGFRIGCATNTIHYNNSAYVNAMKAFNYMVAENGCKFVSIQGTKGKFNFNDCDNHLKKANELGMAFRGHALIWHSMAPKWLENEDSNTMKQSIINHITTVLKHYEGKIDTWDVVNEAIDDGSNGNGWKMRNSFLYQKVPNFIDIAFQTARQVSPKTKLFYNDYNTEGIWAKSESVYQFVADLKKRNIPIDGVGIQYHVGVDVQPKFDSINNLIGRYCKLGVEVHITELDVSCDSSCNDRDGGDGKQGQVYTNALKACLNNSCCTGFLVWGVGDNDSWREGKNKPLLFNSNYQPKGQYTAVLNLLKSTPESVLKNRAGASVQPTQPAEPLGKVVKLNDGWYNIKNPASGKYLCVMDGVGANDQNVEICSTKQKWKLTNGSDNTVTLTTEFGEYNLDVAKGKDENGANIITYRINGGKNQKFIIRDSSTANAYSITTSISNGLRALDIEKEGKVDGANILQWDNGQRSNQIWNFEATSAPSAPQDNPSPSPSTCWSESLGYKCCSSCDVNVQYTDNDGAWGIENNEWCGVPKNCSATCTGAQGYPCCKSNCDVYSSDDDGDWSVENGGWCLINKAKC